LDPPPFPELGRYVTLRPLDSAVVTSFAASIRRTSTKALPTAAIALEISSAASASPSARITAALRS